MRRIVRGMLALAAVAVPAIALAQAKPPVIAVLYFDNNSIGKDHADFDGVGKGIADMLITDMASNPNVKIVERGQIQALLTEQKLTKDKTIDPQTAVRLGKIIGAQYMVTGAFMSDGKGKYVLTSRAINVETSAITNPVRLQSDGQDVLALISELSGKLNNDMKLPALRVGEGVGATPAGQPAQAMPATATPATAVAEKNIPVTKDAKPVTVAQAKPQKKMDIKTAMLYSKALEEMDAGNNTKARELYRQVLDKFPDYTPAQANLQKVSRG